MFLPDFKQDLTLLNVSYCDLVRNYWQFVLRADKVSFDVSIGLLYSKSSVLEFVVREKCFIAGLEELTVLAEMFSTLHFDFLAKDGDFLDIGQSFLRIEGDLKLILSLERVILNFIARMSSIFNQSKLYVDKVSSFSNQLKIMSTRKGLLGSIDKKAASLAGVLTHRLDLGQAVMIKDNHLSNLDFSKLKEEDLLKVEFFEFEFDSLDQFKVIADQVVSVFGRCRGGILLDNFNLPDLKLALDFFANEFENRSFFIEASGGIDLLNLADYDLSGLDAVSTSQVFAFNRVVDLSAVICS